MQDYRKRKPEYVAQRNRDSAETARRKREYVKAQKDVACADCGQRHPHYVMDFDHVPERGAKVFNLSRPSRVSWAAIDAEMAKCDIVCANCHRERTFTRGVDTSDE